MKEDRQSSVILDVDEKAKGIQVDDESLFVILI